jgi:glycosyltransferase involved in cell wall biosynthesis
MVYFDHPETLNRRFAAWYRFLLPQLARKVRRIITVSAFVKERVIKILRVPKEKIAVIPNGVGPCFRPEAAIRSERARLQLGIPTPHYVLALGSIEPRKNLQRLLQAWRRAADVVPQDVWLVVAGEQGNPAIFKSESSGARPARMLITGHVADEILPPLVAGALALAYPSIYEGFGLPALEALASGTPVLAGNCAALREVVGDAGLFVNPLNVSEMEEGLVRITQDSTLREGLRSQGLERAKLFSWEGSAQATWDLLQEVAIGG